MCTHARVRAWQDSTCWHGVIDLLCSSAHYLQDTRLAAHLFLAARFALAIGTKKNVVAPRAWGRGPSNVAANAQTWKIRGSITSLIEKNRCSRRYQPWLRRGSVRWLSLHLDPARKPSFVARLCHGAWREVDGVVAHPPNSIIVSPMHGDVDTGPTRLIGAANRLLHFRVVATPLSTLGLLTGLVVEELWPFFHPRSV